MVLSMDNAKISQQNFKDTCQISANSNSFNLFIMSKNYFIPLYIYFYNDQIAQIASLTLM